MNLLHASRRALLRGGCVAALAMALPRGAAASLLGGAADVPREGPAPRALCPHSGCRFWRAPPGAGDGTCGLSLDGDVVAG